MQALDEQQAENLRQHQCRMQRDKEQLALYWEAQDAARAEAQAVAAVQAKDEAAQVITKFMSMSTKAVQFC